MCKSISSKNEVRLAMKTSRSDENEGDGRSKAIVCLMTIGCRRIEVDGKVDQRRY